MDVINRNSNLPLYQQLYQILKHDIVRGEYAPGTLVPAKSELMAHYSVSRSTVRSVMDMLVNEGLIYRERGRGTFVARPRLEQGLTRIVSFTEDMLQRGIRPSSRVLESTLLPAPTDIAERLEVGAGEELGLLKRLRMGNGEAISLEESYLVHRYCPGFLSRVDYSTTPLRRALEDEYGIRWSHAKQVIDAVNADRSLAELLGVPPRSALLRLERVTWSDRNVPVEFLRTTYRGDRYSLYAELIA